MAATVDNAVAALQRANTELQRRLDEALAERDEGEAQKAAMAEVLEVINSSPGDLAPVFEAMLDKAMHLCGAVFGTLQIEDGDHFRTAATHNVPASFAKYRKDHAFVEGPESIGARIRAGERLVHVLDLKDDEPYRAGDANRRALVDFGRARTGLAVPLTKEKRALGFIIIYRQEVRPFTDKQITLLQNFAAQAVIAIENARLITETQEALDQQTATAEVLGVINASPGDLTPVFEAMLEKAVRLCGADQGTLRTFDGEAFPLAAINGHDLDAVERAKQLGPIGKFGLLEPLVRGERMFHLADIRETDVYKSVEVSRAFIELLGVRTLLAVALQKDGTLLGVIIAFRNEVRPFAEKEIALLQNFAAQAVIAMENARLITETREALDRQTATAEVLGVINGNPGNLQPVFDAMLKRAARLCEADAGHLFRFENGAFFRLASHGVSEDFDRVFPPETPVLLIPRSVPAQMVATRSIMHVRDAREDESYRLRLDRDMVTAVEEAGILTLLFVPLIKEGEVVGHFTMHRMEVKPFSDKQIALLQNFAAQAVIAMENARLLTETREALEQQTATAEVLGVINSSPGDLAPVFDAMLEKATRLCDAFQGVLWLIDGERVRIAATYQMIPQFIEVLRRIERGELPPLPPLRQIMQGECFLISIPNIAEHALYPNSHPAVRAAFEIGHVRSVIWVGLVKDGAAVGAFGIARREVRPFSDAQIALLQNFAAQAVVAIENARLITETREALDQQTATAEVLGVINSSPGDLAPVFEVMVERAAHLCEVDEAAVRTFDGGLLHLVTTHGTDPLALERLRRLGPTTLSGLYEPFSRGDEVVHYLDARDTDTYRNHQAGRQRIDARGIRSWLAVALRKEGMLLGIINVHRRDVRPFTDKQIALLQNFAAQAVIAMENARLLGELQQRTGDLQESLEYQTATSDVLKVMSGSAFELAPVLQTVVSTAVRLCRADQATIYRLEDSEYRWAADHSLTPDYERIERDVRIRPGTGTLVGRVALSRDTVQILDAWTDPLYEVKEDARIGGVHTMLGVPLLREGLPIGVIGLARRRIEPYTDKETELVRTFADQAVIAIENARLLGEIRQRQAELRVTFDNMADGVVMFDEGLGLAAWNRNFQELLDLPDALLAERPSYADYLRILAERGEFGTEEIEAELGRRLQDTNQELRLERTRPDGRVIEVRRNAVPDGGFVLIYSDITERKRSEAEIRAARDVAEAAYADLKAAQANLIQAEKMASLGQLTAGIAHEIKNPLNFVNNFASLSVELLDELKETAAPAIAALDEGKRAEVDDTMELLTGNLEKIAEHGKRADNIVKSMLEHSRGVSGERREVDLNGMVEEALNLAYHGARAQDQSFNITLERDYAASLMPIELAPQEMTRVFLNLFGNGFYAANKRAQEDSNGSFRPSLAVATREDGNAVEVRVRDNGTGIPPEIKDRLFQPFFTTKPTGEGTGLGLSISYDIVTQQHGGTITVESEPGVYTEFTIRLPRGTVAASLGAAN